MRVERSWSMLAPTASRAGLYDRDLTDVFAIHRPWRRRIANALDAKLSRRQKEHSTSSRRKTARLTISIWRAVDYDHEHRPDMHTARS